MQALRAADAAGNTDDARRLARIAADMTGMPRQDMRQLDGQTQAPSVASDVAQSLASGAMRGVAGLADLPGLVVGGGGGAIVSGIERGAQALGIDAPNFFQGARDALAGPFGAGSAARGAAAELTGGFSEREPQTLAGQYAQTVGEFVPGTAIGGLGAGNLVRYGLIPALASEAAGQATQGTQIGGVDVEPYARLAAGLLAPSVAGRALSPFGGADRTRLEMADRLRREGVDVRAGERTGSETLRRLEGSLEPTQQQMEQFTRAALRQVGVDAPRATPEVLRRAESQIVGAMDDVLRGATVQATPGMAQRALSVADDYLQNAPAGSVVPRVRAVVDDIVEAATNPNNQAIDLTRMRSWRSALGRMSQSNDEATRTAAHELRRLIDDATDEALRNAGRTDDIARLSQARERYRNLLAIEDAATRAGAEAGVLSPAQLNQSVIRSQGRQSYAMGRGTDLADLSRAGAATLRQAPTVQAGGVRAIPQLTQGGLMAGGAAAGYQVGGYPGAVAGGLLGGMAQPAAQALVGTAPIQAYLRNQAAQPATFGPSRAGILSSIMAQ